jgi:hypothetical protein
LRSGTSSFTSKSPFSRWHIPCVLNCRKTAAGELCPFRGEKLNQTNWRTLMKVKQLLTMCGVVAALCVSLASIQAQDNGNGGAQAGGNGGGGMRRQRGQGGGFGGGNFDPAQMQQRMMDNIREDLNFTNDTDWNAVQPLVQKVMDARRDVGGAGMGRMFRRNRGQGGPGGGRGFGPQPSPEEDALQKAIDDNAPNGQIKDALSKYRASQKAKQAKLDAAQDELKKVLSVKQEAQAELLGLVK